MLNLTYAFGDIHGRYDLLTKAMERIDRHRGVATITLVFLGDLVDRGPDSKGVVGAVRDLERGRGLREGDKTIVLKGNHEDLMVIAIHEGGSPSTWMGNGAMATLRSYGEDVGPYMEPGLLIRDDAAWMASLATHYEDKHRIYLHAGLMPGYELEHQQPEWKMWIRDRFLRADNEWGKHVVHGHTPQHSGKKDHWKPELLPGRTNLDTAAFYDSEGRPGVLTVGVFNDLLPGGPIEVIQVS